MQVLTVRYGDPEAPALFARSLKETGFAVLNNHPISAQLIQETFDDWAKFFASDAKHDYTFDPKVQAGYFPFRTEKAKDAKVKDLKEFYHWYDWAKLPTGLGSQTQSLFGQLSTLARELLGWVDVATPADIRAQFSMPLSEMVKDSPETLLRPIHYPPLTGDEEAGAIRAAAHEDINLITLLPAATAPGLEVLDRNGNWHAVSCDPGNLVINAGDMLQMATKGYFVSTTHRVMNPTGPAAAAAARQPRYSMPLFLHPRPDVRLSEQHTARSYLEERLREIGLLAQGTTKA